MVCLASQNHLPDGRLRVDKGVREYRTLTNIAQTSCKSESAVYKQASYVNSENGLNKGSRPHFGRAARGHFRLRLRCSAVATGPEPADPSRADVFAASQGALKKLLDSP